MTAPSDLTVTILVTEALYKAGLSSPSAAQITRAGSYFLREVLNDIWKARDKYDNPVKYKALQATNLQITTIGISKFTMPDAFDDDLSVSFLNGLHYGTASAGAASAITLASTEDAAVVDVEGKYILTTGGTGPGQLRQVTDYNATTFVATVGTAWATTPANLTTYRIIDTVTDLTEDSTIGLGSLGASRATGTPSQYAIITEEGVTYLLLDKPPDASTYGIFTRYYADPNFLDLAGDVMTRLYNTWQNVLTYGVASKITEDNDDNKYSAFKQQYEASKQDLIAKESPASGEFVGFTL